MDREVSAWKRELRRNPGSIAFAQLAERLREQGKLDEATWVCARGLTIHPDYSTGRAILGEILLEGGLKERAEEEFSLGVKLDSLNVRCRVGLARICLDKGCPKEAVSQLDDVLFWQPLHEQALDLLERAHSMIDSKQVSTLIGPDAPPRQVAPPTPESPQPGAAKDAPANPPGLIAGREAELAGLLADCETITGAIIVDSEGLLVASEAALANPGDEAAARLAAFCNKSSHYLKKLGLGYLEAGLIEMPSCAFRILRYQDFIVSVSLKQDAKLGAAQVEIDGAVAQLDRRKKVRASDLEKATNAPEMRNA